MRQHVRTAVGTSPIVRPALWTRHIATGNTPTTVPQHRCFSSSGPGGVGPQSLGSIFGTNPSSGSYLKDYTVDLTENP